MSARQRFPDRRGSVRFSFTHAGRLYSATLSKFADGQIGEIFIIRRDKPDFELAVHANDAAVLASLLLQHGVTAAAIEALHCRSVGHCARARRGWRAMNAPFALAAERRVDPLDAFKLRAEARAYLWAAGEYDDTKPLTCCRQPPCATASSIASARARCNASSPAPSSHTGMSSMGDGQDHWNAPGWKQAARTITVAVPDPLMTIPAETLRPWKALTISSPTRSTAKLARRPSGTDRAAGDRSLARARSAVARLPARLLAQHHEPRAVQRPHGNRQVESRARAWGALCSRSRLPALARPSAGTGPLHRRRDVPAAPQASRRGPKAR